MWRSRLNFCIFGLNKTKLLWNRRHKKDIQEAYISYLQRKCGNALDLCVPLPQLFHPEEDGLDGIREVNGMRLLLVGIDKERQEVQFISEWGPMWGVENLLQPQALL